MNTHSISRSLILLVLSAFIITGCSRNPVTGKRMISFVSADGEKRIGAQNDPSIVAQFGVYDDKNMANFVTRKGNEMVKQSHMPDGDFTFRLLDSEVVNAFALPGGYVYFTRGIMAHFNNEAEFAGVLGHEIGHVTGRHGAKQQTKAIGLNALLIAGSIASPTFGQFSDIAGQGLGLLMLKYGRDDESQSDQLGVIYSTNVGYDSHEMADFFKTLQRLSAGSGADGIPNFLSTHPDPGDRYNAVNEYTDKVRADRNKNIKYKVNRDSYLQMIDGLVYGTDPNQGFAENNVFYHPELKFQFPYPNGWNLSNTPSQVQIAPSDGNALMLFTLAAEKSLDAAYQAQITADNLKVIDKQGFKVNGLQVISGEFLQATDNGNIQILTYFIKDGNYIYKMHGMALQANFSSYKNTFVSNFREFDRLTDPNKLNRQPMRIKIQTVSATDQLQNILRSSGMPSGMIKELSILNGMLPTDKVMKGEKIKLLSGVSGS